LSPLLANIALSALDDYFAEIWQATKTSNRRQGIRKRGGATYRLVRYADDFVVMVYGTREHAEALRAQITQVLAPLGLRLSEAKTSVVHFDEGFDFLGWRIQRRRKRGTAQHHLYTYPSKKALLSVMARVRTLTRRANSRTLFDLLHRLNRVLRGWATYFKHGVSKQTFSYLGQFAWQRLAPQTTPGHLVGTTAPTLPPRMATDAGRDQPVQPGHRNGHPLPLPGLQDPAPMDSNNHRGLTQRHGPVESRMLGNGHVRFGGRAEETDQPKDWHRASARPNTYVKVAGWTYLYRAVDQHGQVIDVLVSQRRDAAAARTFFARALAVGPSPVEVTDQAPVYPRVVDELVPGARHILEQYANNSAEADHGRLKARLRPMRGLKSIRSLRTVAAGHAFVQNLRRGH
jgi:hypothetical protein